WEARKIWGSLVNDSRTWARQILYLLSSENIEDHKEIEEAKTRAIHRHIAFLYALKSNLRGDDKKHYRKYISSEECIEVETHSNKHNAILNLQSKELKNFVTRDWINGFEFLELNKMLICFSDEMGMSERIKNTVFPTTYTFFTKLAIWLFVICTVAVFDETVGPWCVLFGIIIGYVFLVIHFIGLALVNPFDLIPTGISLDQITRTIEINLLETLKEPNIPPPVESFNNLYVM
ncbi:MAG: bestrophin family protein, partial [Flavobacteriaceae bacterium]